MPQTTHAIEMPVARAGLVADSGIVQDTISRLAEDAAGARAGTFLVPGTDAEHQAVAPTTAAEITDGDGLGVVMYDASKMPAIVAAAIAAGNEYDVEDMLPLVGKGRMWVLCDDAAVIVANTPAFVRFAQISTPAGVLGAFRQDVDTADAAALPNAVFRSAHRDVDFDQAGTQRIALVELNLPSV
jgi:hypothetical protein